MARIKIISDPYNRRLSYYIERKETGQWDDVEKVSQGSRLREIDEEKIFFPFKAKEIVDIIIREYYTGKEEIVLEFEGTKDEYDELMCVCESSDNIGKVKLLPLSRWIANAQYVLDETSTIFNGIKTIIEHNAKDDDEVKEDMKKISNALDKVVPICVMGNYSAGKSTFINSLIGYEILPSGVDPVTAKIIRVKRSTELDKAKISFTFFDKPYIIVFERNGYMAVVGNKDEEIVKHIDEAIDALEDKPLHAMVNKTLEVLNNFEKRDMSVTEISDVIEVEVPFCLDSVLGASDNEYVIFDTPGSNSKSNEDHGYILRQALAGFSNGIPVWVTGYDSIDSIDNANLCGMISEIDALDKRFTMIVVNKADAVQLPKEGFKKEDVDRIVSYDSVRQMYANGIYFVSAGLGLAAKNYDGVISEFIKEVWDEKRRKYSDPYAFGHRKLYEYDIMPEQMKNRVREESIACDNVVYANSGLYCIERKMEEFAEKYAAYNKCMMVFLFLGKVVEKTNKIIDDKTEEVKRKKEERVEAFERKKKQLIEEIHGHAQETSETQKSMMATTLENYCEGDLAQKSFASNFEAEYEGLIDMYEKEEDVASLQDASDKGMEGFKTSLLDSFKESVRLFSLTNMNASSFRIHDYIETPEKSETTPIDTGKNFIEKKKQLDSAKKKALGEASERLIQIVNKLFKDNIGYALTQLQTFAKSNWDNVAEDYRRQLVALITGSDALTEEQRKELSEIILNYDPVVYEEDEEDMFEKERFTGFNLLWFKISFSDRLDTKKLLNSFNEKMEEEIDYFADLISESYFKTFKHWQDRLVDVVEQNITEYNPQLQELSKEIIEDEKRIEELKGYRTEINSSHETIKEMVSWQEA